MTTVIITTATLFLSLNIFTTTAFAEIATAKDWLGIFQVQSNDSNRTATGQDNPFNWVYTGNTPSGANCPSTTPWLFGNCSLQVPFNPGAYEFRLYANNSRYLIATSGQFWVTFSPSATQGCDNRKQPYIEISWPALLAVDHLDIYRKLSSDTNFSKINNRPILPTSIPYTDSSINANNVYNYHLQTFSRRFTSSNPYSTTPITVSVISCTQPFIQTTTGDVHSNIKIETPQR